MASRPDSPRPTLADIGRLVGISAAAASMALRNSPRISRSTKERVRKVAKKLGYVPDPMLSALVARRLGQNKGANVAVLFDSNWNEEGTSWFKPIFDGLRSESARLGYNLEILSIQKEILSLSSPDRMLQSRGILGLIILPIRMPHLSLKLDWSRYSIICMSRWMEAGHFHHFISNPPNAMATLCSRLYERGYRRLGIAHSHAFERRANFEWTGSLYKESLAQPKLKMVPPYLPEQLTEKNFHAWMRRHRPDCVVSAAAFPIIDYLSSGGWKVPDDVGIAALTINPGMEHFSGILQQTDLIAHSAMQYIHSLIQSNETGLPDLPREIRITFPWHEGDTTRPLVE